LGCQASDTLLDHPRCKHDGYRMPTSKITRNTIDYGLMPAVMNLQQKE